MIIIKFLQSLKRINLLIEPTLRYYIVLIRIWYYVRISGQLRTLESENAVKANAMHNLKSLYGANNRTNLLIFPLAIIETLNINSRILVIGPRNENDIFALRGLGFKLKNIVGLDLISYSKYIKLGDMHHIPFPNDSFDAIICGWTLSYSTDPYLAASEMFRVTRPGGIVGIGVEYSTMGPDDEEKLLGYQIQEFEKIGARVNSTAQILTLFKDMVNHVYFNHDAPRRVSHSSSGLVENVSNVAVVFSIKEKS